MFDVHAVKRDFSRAANSYESEARLQMQVLKHLATQLKEDAFVLDAGCATGVLASLVKNKVIGVDLAPNMCAHAAKRMEVANADVVALPFADSTFDAVVSNFVLQWVNDVEAAFKEFARVLKHDGVALVTSFGPQTLAELKTQGLSVSEFLPLENYVQHAKAAEFTVKEASSTLYVEHFDSMHALMLHLKTIGATNKRKDRNKGLNTALKKLCDVPISTGFEVLTLHLVR